MFVAHTGCCVDGMDQLELRLAFVSARAHELVLVGIGG